MDLESKISVSLLSLVVGALLAGAGRIIQTAYQEVGTRRRAISYLLEIRHLIFGRLSVVALFSARYRLNPQDLIILDNLIADFFPAPDPKLGERLNAALDILAERDPLLAFRLRGKDQISAALAKLSSIPASNELEARFILDARRAILESAKTTLDEVILDAASDPLNLALKDELEVVLRAQPQLPSEVQKFLRQLDGVVGPTYVATR